MTVYYLKLLNPVDGTNNEYFYWGYCQPNGNTQNSTDLREPMWFENKEDAERLLERINSRNWGLKERYGIVEKKRINCFML